MDDEYHEGRIHGLECAVEFAFCEPPADQWIPCSSGRVPTEEDYSEDGFVLVQTGGDIIYKGRYEDGFWTDEVGFTYAYLPIAWRRLPEPYKGVE